jgi:hypothetical protein
VRDIASLIAITIRPFIRLEPGIYFSRSPPPVPAKWLRTVHIIAGRVLPFPFLSGWCESRKMPFWQKYGVRSTAKVERR